MESYAERNIVMKELGKNVNIDDMNINDRMYVRFQIATLLVSGVPIEFVPPTGDMTLTELRKTIEERMKGTFEELKKEDAKMQQISKQDAVSVLENIDIILLTTDRLFDARSLSESLDVSIAGVKGILSAA